MATSDEAPNGLFRVISLTGALPRHLGCSIIPADNIFIGIFTSVFGPADHGACVDWVAHNCQRVDEAALDDTVGIDPLFYGYGDTIEAAIADASGNMVPGTADALVTSQIVEWGATLGGIAGIRQFWVVARRLPSQP